MKKSIIYCIFIILLLMITYYIREKINVKTKSINLLDNIEDDDSTILETFDQEDEDISENTMFTFTKNNENMIYHYWNEKDTNGGIVKQNAISVMNKLYSHSKIFFKLSNTKIDEYGISFYFKKGCDTDKIRTIVCCKDNNTAENNKIIWSIKYLKNVFYIKYGFTPDKYSETLTIESSDQNKIYSVYISYSYSKKKLFCYIGSDSKIIEIEKEDLIQPSSENNIIFNSESQYLYKPGVDCFNDDKGNKGSDCEYTMSISNIFKYNKFITENDIGYDPVCKYDPSNDTDSNMCKEKCIKELNCKTTYCNNICNTIGRNLKEPIIKDLEPNPPKKIRVTGIDKGFKIEFKKPAFQGYQANIDKFIIIVKPLYVDGDDMENRTKIYNFSTQDNQNCEYTVSGLINDKFYNISVFSHNDKGYMSLEPSNIETEQPKGKTMEAHPALLETENQIQKIIESEDQNFNSACFGDESKKYKFSSSILDGEKINNMYKYGGTNFDNTFLNKINPNMENILLDIERVDSSNNNNSAQSEAVIAMKDFDESLNF
jgi:hypothetical protein